MSALYVTKFCCVVGKEKSSDNTYKTFREWLALTFKDGKPNEDQWMGIVEDNNSDFTAGPWGNRDLNDNPESEDDIITMSPRHWVEVRM
jgi:hypothetical protein